ncbi:sigma-70 family RNA polymerase sigma factor [Kitasatospora sp. MAP5-34]|uniref:sigma-70 family RNA polymerase sigma factor n=1 Tax=Kitasatospora sp. MAP5-34 TaxID=3035102 RepID=UPI002475437F|nr:sigma-70 family RNA polymerase sigma factor [Kitasatospora sp. MAP5-34]MDH6575853.1 RNA polymerase sigma factor (sigma-70 family) [Kitasatospora sp. MAP5-34]
MNHRLTELRPAFAPLAAALARRHRLDPQDLEQDVWLRVFEHARAEGGLPRDLTSWLRALTLQECRPVTRTALEPPAIVPSAEEEALAAERRRAVRLALARLPGRCPELLTALAARPDLTYRQIARLLGMPQGSIGPTRSRCLACLRALLSGHRD